MRRVALATVAVGIFWLGAPLPSHGTPPSEEIRKALKIAPPTTQIPRQPPTTSDPRQMQTSAPPPANPNSASTVTNSAERPHSKACWVTLVPANGCRLDVSLPVGSTCWCKDTKGNGIAGRIAPPNFK